MYGCEKVWAQMYVQVQNGLQQKFKSCSGVLRVAKARRLRIYPYFCSLERIQFWGFLLRISLRFRMKQAYFIYLSQAAGAASSFIDSESTSTSDLDRFCIHVFFWLKLIPPSKVRNQSKLIWIIYKGILAKLECFLPNQNNLVLNISSLG